MPGGAGADTGQSVSAQATARLRDWNRRRRLVLGVGAGALGLLAIANAAFPISRDASLAVLVGLACCVGVPGLILQFRECCPGCGARLGWQSALRLPTACRRCAMPLVGPGATEPGAREAGRGG